MLTSVSKKFNITRQHFFQLFDPKKRLLLLIGIIFIISCMEALISPAVTSYIEMRQQGISLKEDQFYDYTLPLLSAFIVCLAFFKDYTSKIHELFSYYNHARFHYIMLYRWSFYVGLFTICCYCAGLLNYRNMGEFTFVLSAR